MEVPLESEFSEDDYTPGSKRPLPLTTQSSFKSNGAILAMRGL